MAVYPQTGLEWVQSGLGLEPRWTVDMKTENIEKFLRRKYALEDNVPCSVAFHAAGAFNKLYRVEFNNQEYLLRVSLPVDPHFKVMSEIATLEFVRRQTPIPVPQVFDCSNSSSHNANAAAADHELGFEWILLSFEPGRPLCQQWRKLSMNTKSSLVETIARYQTHLLTSIFPHHRIGNIFLRNPPCSRLCRSQSEILMQPSAKIETFYLGRIVSPIFFWGDNIKQDVDRGSFESTNDWLRARLSLIMNNQTHIIQHTDDEDDIAEAVTVKVLALALHNTMPTVFPQNDDSAPKTALWNSDLSMSNILVSDDGIVTAIIDWECVPVVPLWLSSQLPTFLIEVDRDKEPIRGEYGDEDEDEAQEAADEGLDNEGKTGLYWVHLLQYGLTQLRRDYLAELKSAWSASPSVQADSCKADFEFAISRCDSGFGAQTIIRWVNTGA